VKTASEMTYTVSSGALNSTQTPTNQPTTRLQCRRRKCRQPPSHGGCTVRIVVLHIQGGVRNVAQSCSQDDDAAGNLSAVGSHVQQVGVRIRRPGPDLGQVWVKVKVEIRTRIRVGPKTHGVAPGLGFGPGLRPGCTAPGS